MMRRIVSNNNNDGPWMMKRSLYERRRRNIIGYCCCGGFLIISVIIMFVVFMLNPIRGNYGIFRPYSSSSTTTAVVDHQMKNKTIFSNVAKTTTTTTKTNKSNSGTSISESRFTNNSSGTNPRSSSTGSISSSSSTSSMFPAVDALSSLSPIQQKRRQYRVLAYGDSLTAGTSGHSLYPYAVYLEQALYERQQRKERSDGIGTTTNTITEGVDEIRRSIIVRHRGIPGMKVQDMVTTYIDDERRGLRNVLQNIHNPSLSIVIILAGTNDIGYELHYNNNNVEVASQTIGNNILQLHYECYKNIPSLYTIAIGIPSSGYQYRNMDAANVAIKVNEQLQQAATAVVSTGTTISVEENGSTTTTTTTATTSTTIFPIIPFDKKGRSRMIYVQFPFEYEPNGENWNIDTLHFSQKGYETLGYHLAPIVEQIIYEYLEEDDLR